MDHILIGFIAGVMSGIIMGLVSNILFRLHLFKSSLILIDGSFLFRTINRTAGPVLLYAAGFTIHLITSGVFGAVYTAAAGMLGFEMLSPDHIGLYSAVLWLAMLFIALPVAGEGIAGHRSGPGTWLEQLILHAIFGAALYVCLVAFL